MSTFQAQFDDMDHLCEVIRGWDLDLVQLDRGAFEGQLLQYTSRSAAFSFARFDRLLEQRGSPPPGTWTFAIPQADCRPLRWHGAEAGPGDIMVFPPGWDLHAVSSGEFHVVTISVPEERLFALATQETLSFRGDAKAGWVSRRSAQSLAPLLAELADLEGVLRAPTHAAAAEAEARIQAALVPELLRVFDDAQFEPTDARAPMRRAALERALAVIDSCHDEPPTVAELCFASRASLRTLRRAFLERFGVSPKAYMQARRLHQARKQLLRSDPRDVRIADVAGKLGFWHMGKFAGDYSRQFGELPSETLRR